LTSLVPSPRVNLTRFHGVFSTNRRLHAQVVPAQCDRRIYLEIAGQYHHDIHRMIGTTPAAAWEKSLARGTVSNATCRSGAIRDRVPYADVRRPPITLAELRFAHAELRREAKGSINEERLLAMHDRQNAIVTNATKATKAARRRNEPRQQHTAATVSTVSSIDYSKAVVEATRRGSQLGSLYLSIGGIVEADVSWLARST
jgi:hypothetical protein